MPEKINMITAINLALRQELKRDKSVLLLGEDIGKNGGVFRVTEGLWKEFGDNRIIDTPLSESGIVGVSLGLAINGFKPIAEIQFSGFLGPAWDQITNHVARYRNRTRGCFNVPIVIRVPCTGGVRALEHHSESPETFYIHVPGIKVVMPSTPYNAKGLLVSAIRDPDPVIFFEPKRSYRSIKQEVPHKQYSIPLGKADVVNEGDDLTVITWGAMLRETKEALGLVKDISVELIDLQTLYPLDQDTIVNSVKKTGRCLIVQEAPKTLGLASEIISIINDKALLSLEAPVKRLTGYDIVMPLPKMEKIYIPSHKRIADSIREVVNF